MAVRGQSSPADQVALSQGNGKLANILRGDLETIPYFTAGTPVHFFDEADGENRNDRQQVETA